MAYSRFLLVTLAGSATTSSGADVFIAMTRFTRRGLEKAYAFFTQRSLKMLQLSKKVKSVVRGTICAAALVVAGGSVYSLGGCSMTLPDTPIGPVKIEPAWSVPNQGFPPAGTPGTTMPNPLSPGRTVQGYDLDGDGSIDLVYDPITGAYYWVKKIPRSGVVVNGSLLDEGPVDYDGPGNETRGGYAVDGCVLSNAALPWNASSAEDFIQNHDLDMPNGQVSTVQGLAYAHAFDAEGEADVTLYWSTDHGIARPTAFNLCSSMYALPSLVEGAPSGLQIRVRGTWQDVSRWLIAMGVQEFSVPVGGLSWTLTAVPGQSAIDLAVEGVYFDTISLD